MSTKAPVSYYKIVSLPAPAAGANFTLTTPGGEYWVMHNIVFRFVASAAVANRVVHLIADDATDTYFRTVANSLVAAAGDQRFCGFDGAPQSTAVGNDVMFPLPSNGLLLPPGYRFRSSTDAIDIADQYSEIRALVQSFPQGPVDEWLPTVDTQIYEMG